LWREMALRLDISLPRARSDHGDRLQIPISNTSGLSRSPKFGFVEISRAAAGAAKE
jgi:hypothetical protein